MKEKLWTRNFILLVMASLGSGFLVSLFLNTLPLYAEQMTGTAVYAGLVTSCYSMAALATRPVVGILCEKMSALKLIIIGLVMMAVSCYAYSFATAIAGLLFIRILHGIGFGIKSTASGVLAAEIIPKSRFAEGIGMFGLYLPVANAIGTCTRPVGCRKWLFQDTVYDCRYYWNCVRWLSCLDNSFVNS